MAEPRPSTDQESAPLLRDPENGQANGGGRNSTYGEQITSVVQEPLTPLTKILLVVTLLLLLLSSVFIGLFAGAQHKLHLPPDRGGPPRENPPVTYTRTATATATATATTTKIQTATTTDIYTTTVEPHIPEPTKPPADGACLSANCVVLSASILSSLDTTQDPCENFYEYATGGWTKSHPIPADKGRLGTFTVLSQENKQVIREILESTDIPTTDVARSYDEQTLHKLRGMYASCMDEDTLNDLAEEPLWDFVKTVRDLFRGKSTEISSKKKDGDKYNGLTAAIAFLHSRDVDALFTTSIEGDVGEDPNAMTLWFSQPGLGLPSKEYYEDKDVVKIYTDVIERLLSTLTDDEDDDEDFLVTENKPEAFVQQDDNENVWPPWPWPPWGDDGDDKAPKPEPTPHRPDSPSKQAKKVVEFEKKIADASLDLEKLTGDPFGTYNPMPIANLTSSLPQIHFSEYFATFTPRSYPSRVIVTYPEYYHSLSKILKETSAEVVEAYLVTRTALTFSPFLGMETEAWQAERSLQETLKGIKKGAVGERWETCVQTVEDTLGFAIGRFFVNETFAGESRTKATKVITDIVTTFKKSLDKLEWMDKKSATAAAKKADNIKVKVGFPLSPDTRQPRSIFNYYSRVEIKKDHYFRNILSAAASEKSIEWMKLGKTRDPETWEMYPSTVNAYFSPEGNQIVFPAGILQPPFFSREWPAYLAYGSFGMVAAHELTHAFDSTGRLYNQDAKLEEWWTNATSEGFNERQKCIVDQYSAYTVDDGKGGKVHVNGNLTSGENIGDSGIILAYRAWKAQFHASDNGGSEYFLPGLNYTREQMFFVSFARTWATNIRPESAVQGVRTDPHSPAKWRVDGTLSNVPEFAEAFKCKKGSKLNPPPKDRCIFW